jgi:hypothetical protein
MRKPGGFRIDMICDEIKRMFPPPPKAEAHVAAVAAIGKEPGFTEAHLRTCPDCKQATESRRQPPEDEPRLLLIVAISDWWLRGVRLMQEDSPHETV